MRQFDTFLHHHNLSVCIRFCFYHTFFLYFRPFFVLFLWVSVVTIEQSLRLSAFKSKMYRSWFLYVKLRWTFMNECTRTHTITYTYTCVYVSVSVTIHQLVSAIYFLFCFRICSMESLIYSNKKINEFGDEASNNTHRC